VSWRYAKGRAFLSTLGPVLVGSTISEIAPSSERAQVAGLAIVGAGLLVGPSMGQWCLGGSYARESIFPMVLRAAGEGAVAGALIWGGRQVEDAEGIGGVLGAAMVSGLATLPGIIVTLAGVAWAFNQTPRYVCEGEPQMAAVSVSPTAGGRGVALSVRF
jgi:hypothetical protein